MASYAPLLITLSYGILGFNMTVSGGQMKRVSTMTTPEIASFFDLLMLLKKLGIKSIKLGGSSMNSLAIVEYFKRIGMYEEP
jgi:hypothetical protein